MIVNLAIEFGIALMCIILTLAGIHARIREIV